MFRIKPENWDTEEEAEKKSPSARFVGRGSDFVRTHTQLGFFIAFIEIFELGTQQELDKSAIPSWKRKLCSTDETSLDLKSRIFQVKTAKKSSGVTQKEKMNFNRRV